MKKLTVSFIWEFIGRIGNQIITLITTIILARMLTPSEYGLIGMAVIALTFANIFSNLGLSSAIIQKADVDEKHLSSTFYFNTIFSLFIGIIFYCFSSKIAFFFNEDELSQIIKVLSFSILFSGGINVFEANFKRLLDFKKLTQIKLYSVFFSGFLGIFFAYRGYGVWSLVIQYFSNIVFKFCFFYYFSNWRPKPIFSLAALKSLWTYGLNIFFSGLIYSSYNQLSGIIIAKFFSGYDLGIFNRAKSLNELAYKYTSESINAVAFPKMSQIQNDYDKLISMGLKTENLITYTSFAILGLMYIISEPLIIILLGSKWLDVIPVYELLCLSSFIYPLNVASLSMLKAAGYSGVNLKLEVLKTIIGLSGMLIGFSFGIEGFLYSLIFIGVLQLYSNIHFVSKALNYNYKLHIGPIFKYLIITLISAFILKFLSIKFDEHFLTLVVNGTLFIFTYLIFNKLFKTKGLMLLRSQLSKI